MTADNFAKIILGEKTATRRVSARWMGVTISQILDVRIARNRDEGLRVRVTGRKRQPLRDISPPEVWAEGVNTPGKTSDYDRDRFRELWDSLHFIPSEQWAANPDVSAIDFALHSYDPPHVKNGWTIERPALGISLNAGFPETVMLPNTTTPRMFRSEAVARLYLQFWGADPDDGIIAIKAPRKPVDDPGVQNTAQKGKTRRNKDRAPNPG